MVGQLVGVQALPLLQGHGFFAFQRLRGFAPAQAGQVGGDVGAEAVAFDLDHQVFAVGAAQHKVGGVAVPAAIVAQVFSVKVGLGGVGDAAGKPHAFDLVGLVLQLAQRPLQKARLGQRVKVVALVVKAARQCMGGVCGVCGAEVELFFIFGKADAGGVHGAAAALGAVKAVGLHQGNGHVDFFEVGFVLRPLRLDLQAQGVEVVVGHVGARTVGLAQGGQHFGGGQVVVGSQLGGCGVGVQLGRRGGQLVTTAVYLLQRGVARCGLHGCQGFYRDACGGRHIGGHGEVQRRGAGGVAHLAAVAKHALFDEQRRQVGPVQHDFALHPLGLLGTQVFERCAVGFGQLGFERFFVAVGQVHAGGHGIAGHLAQAACGGLQHKVVAVGQLAHQGGGKQAGAVPALSAHVDQEQHALGSVGVAGHGLKLAARGFAAFAVHRQDGVSTNAAQGQGRFHRTAQFVAGFDVGKVQGQACGRAGVAAHRRQAHGPVIAHKVLNHVGHQGVGLAIAQVKHLDVVGQLFQHTVTNAFAQPVPHHHVAQGLAFKIRRAGGVDDDDEVGLGGQVVDGAAHFFNAVVLEHQLAGFLVLLPLAQQFLAIGVVSFVREHGQVRQRGHGLQAQVGQLGLLFRLGARKQTRLLGIGAHVGLLDADFFGVGDDDVERAAPDDGDLLVAVAREGELEAGRKGLVHAGRQQLVVRHVGQFAQRAQDGFAGREDERVLHKRAFGVFHGHGKFGGHDGAHQNGFARTHGQREDVAGVVQRQGFAQAFQMVVADKLVVFTHPLDQGAVVVLGFLEQLFIDAHGVESVGQVFK